MNRFRLIDEVSMSKPQITEHKLGKLQNILRKVKIFFPLFPVLKPGFGGHPIFGVLMLYSFKLSTPKQPTITYLILKCL